MKSRHYNEILSRLERVYDVGCSEIRYMELLLWYGQEKVSASIWRDLEGKWNEVLENTGYEGTPLFVGQADGVCVFVWGRGVSSDGEWLKDVQSLSRTPPATG